MLAVVVVHLWWGSGFCDSVGAWSCGGSAVFSGSAGACSYGGGADACLHGHGLDKAVSMLQELLQVRQEEQCQLGLELPAIGRLQLFLQHGQSSQAAQGVVLIGQIFQERLQEACQANHDM